jgi:hypothetical protein
MNRMLGLILFCSTDPGDASADDELLILLTPPPPPQL